MCGETGKQYGLGRSQVSALSAYLGITAFEFVERVQEIGNLKTNTAGLRLRRLAAKGSCIRRLSPVELWARHLSAIGGRLEAF